MLHLAGDTREARLEQAKREVADFAAGGVDAIMVENYYGDATDMENVLEWLAIEPDMPLVGVNVLRDYRKAFEFCGRFPVSIVQIDSVAGHLAPEEDAAYAKDLALLRDLHDVLVFGGVRFKYQPIRSGRTMDEDLLLGMERCDAIVVTGTATGEETGREKIEAFREVIGDFPLIVGAGLTVENAAEQLELVDGAIVGSYFKDTYRDTGVVDRQHVVDLIQVVDGLREPLVADIDRKVEA
jgi:predicted TIM-barrel enzyme